ncbi:LysR substrate-binding domain-containing protein [Novosphingobium sp. SG751A]|uniref:LysR substrate-binding domain-containing protein n=1 Tax=Novosphingobium sp. SG751A TaxID=2587000 RepID=UPI001554C132|nr:LysR substrate-binding domain-containing protein [Novosphingobium sp. SG751A]
MTRHVNLRQIEAFKAVIENGTVSRGAEVLNISQPAMSKLIAHLEMDTGLKLFDRVKKRLAPTEHAMRLYKEVERIFAGVRQVESAIDVIRRQNQGRLVIGVIPALSGNFIQRVTARFLAGNTNVFCELRSLSSTQVVDRVLARKLDVGVINGRVDNPYLTCEPLMEHALVCVMPIGHPLSRKHRVEPADLDNIAFIGFDAEVYIGQLVDRMIEASGIRPNVVVSATMSLPVCEMVAAGLGVSLVHPLMLSGLEDRVAVRPFGPDIKFKFQLCRNPEDRNAKLMQAFAQHVRDVAAQISKSVLSGA